MSEIFGLFRDRRYKDESCSCLKQATVALHEVGQECKVTDEPWFANYEQRRFKENRCGEIEFATKADELAKEEDLVVHPPLAFAILAIVVAGCVLVFGLAVIGGRHLQQPAVGYMPLLE